jgi:putative heme-binding domain-containing protein
MTCWPNSGGWYQSKFTVGQLPMKTLTYLSTVMCLMPVCVVFAQQISIPADAASVDAGKQIYMGSCSACHGATGEGSQGPSLLSGRASRLPDRTLLSSIKNGLPGTSMPNFPMPDEKVLQVAAFVRSLTAPAVSTQVPGDPERGRRIFFAAGRCSSCHMILGQGGHPGPDLSNSGADRTVPQLRESILKPSARIADGYRGITAVLKSGRTVQGVAKNQNNYSVQILDRAGQLHLLNRDEISKLEIMDASLMPPVSDPDEAIHLVAFLARQSTRSQEAQVKAGNSR